MRRKVLLTATMIAIVDQIIKLAVTKSMDLNQEIIIIKNFFSIFYVQNDGAAWSILSGNRILLIMVSVFFLYASLKYFLLDDNISKLEMIGYGMLIGGVTGNLIDRIISGNVIDYLAFNLFGYHFPVFNVADMSIVVGAFLVFYQLLIVMRVKKHARI